MNKVEHEIISIVADRTSKMNQSKKVPVYLKLNSDVLGWFRSRGKGYQSYINDVLYEFVFEYSKREAAKSEHLSLAQSLFHRFYMQCFWHLREDLDITESEIPLIIEGLRKYGGRQGFEEASRLCQ